MSQLRWENKITRFFLLLSASLILVIFGEWLFAEKYREKLRSRVENTQGAGYQADAVPVYNFLQHPVDHYEEMVERPLFIEGRQPIEESSEATAIDPADLLPKGKFDLVFTGSIMTPEDGPIALFENRQSKNVNDKFIKLAEGGDYNGWIVIVIKPDRVLLKEGINEEEIMLRAPKKKTNPLRNRKVTRRKVRKQPKTVKNLK